MTKTFIGGYWNNRPEDIKSAAHRVENFLNQLKEIDSLFSNLKLPAFSKKQQWLIFLK